MEFAEESEDEHMPISEEVELISKRTQRMESVEVPAPAPGEKTARTMIVAGSGSCAKLPLGVGFLIVALVVFSTALSMLRNVHEGERAPYAPKDAGHIRFPYTVAVSRTQLISAANGIGRALAKIDSAWRVREFPLFKSLVHMPPASWHLQKSKFITLLLRDNELKTPYKYVAVFTGSSITAGHDNFVSEMYSAVFNDILTPVFQELNMEFEVCLNSGCSNAVYPPFAHMV